MVAIDEDFLLLLQGEVDTVDGLVHVLHQEWVVQPCGELRTEEAPGFFLGRYATLYEQLSDDRIEVEFSY